MLNISLQNVAFYPPEPDDQYPQGFYVAQCSNGMEILTGVHKDGACYGQVLFGVNAPSGLQEFCHGQKPGAEKLHALIVSAWQEADLVDSCNYMAL